MASAPRSRAAPLARAHSATSLTAVAAARRTSVSTAPDASVTVSPGSRGSQAGTTIVGHGPTARTGVRQGVGVA